MSKLKVSDMHNKAMTNEEAISIIESNLPGDKYYILRDALTLAVKALKMTSRKMERERKDGEN